MPSGVNHDPLLRLLTADNVTIGLGYSYGYDTNDHLPSPLSGTAPGASSINSI